MRKNNATKTLRHKFKIGRMSILVWLKGLTVLMVVAAAGQAVGPVQSGGIQGFDGLTIEQSVVLSSTSADHGVFDSAGGGGSPHDDAIVTVNDEGTAFTASIELHVGDTEYLVLDLDNVSDVQANAIMELNVPAGIDFEVDDLDGDISEAQLNRKSWLMKLDTVSLGSSGDLEIAFSPKDDLRPGFYTITGRIVQVANSTNIIDN